MPDLGALRCIPSETLVISGAGISRDSGLPTGWELLTEVLGVAARADIANGGFEGLDRSLLAQWERAELRDEYGALMPMPRLETVIGILAQPVVRQLVGTTLGVLRHLVWTTLAPAERDHLVGGLPGSVS